MAKQLQTKALRAFGLASNSLPPREVVRHVTTHNSLRLSEYVAFWREVLHKPMVTARFFGELVSKILEIEKHDRKSKVAQHFDVERALYSMIHTIQFIDLFCQVDMSHTAIERSFKAWESFRQMTLTTKMSAAISMFERTMVGLMLCG
jgi:hypothetical protein